MQLHAMVMVMMHVEVKWKVMYEPRQPECASTSPQAEGHQLMQMMKQQHGVMHAAMIDVEHSDAAHVAHQIEEV